MGPLWVDVAGYELDAEDKEILAHPTVGGLILFTRNYHDSQQLQALVASIRRTVKRPFLIGVDQEGGRVQRFREGFSPIPAAAEYAKHAQGEALACMGGWLMAAELIAHDIDLSFAPVLDKGFACKAIGNRAFGEETHTILRHSSAYMQGMRSIGMATTGKHFPGHGGVIADSHLETPIDERDDLWQEDMAIFKAQIEAGMLDAMMPAHVIYPQYDSQPASGSSYWLKQVLRQELGFKGLIFSDDLTMEGAAVMGGPAERAKQALHAGCDMLLMCNKRDAQVAALDSLPITSVPSAAALLKKQSFTLDELTRSQEWKTARDALQRLLP